MLEWVLENVDFPLCTARLSMLGEAFPPPPARMRSSPMSAIIDDGDETIRQQLAEPNPMLRNKTRNLSSAIHHAPEAAAPAPPLPTTSEDDGAIVSASQDAFDRQEQQPQQQQQTLIGLLTQTERHDHIENMRTWTRTTFSAMREQFADVSNLAHLVMQVGNLVDHYLQHTLPLKSDDELLDVTHMHKEISELIHSRMNDLTSSLLDDDPFDDTEHPKQPDDAMPSDRA